MVIKNSEQFFYANDGAVLKSVQEMLDWMKSTSNETFGRHINLEKNDFVPWIAVILKDKTLAKKIEGTNSREDIIEAVEERLSKKNRKKSTKKTLISQIKEAISDE